MTEIAMKEQTSPSDFKKGLHSGLSIAIGYAPIALTFGLLAKSTGLTLAETVMMSMIVFAGASQYMSLTMLTLGTSIFEIITTTFIVNIRHFLMSAALNEKAEDDSTLSKAVYSFGITDETFSIAAVKEGKITAGYMLGVNLIAYASWVVFSGVGHVIGASIPAVLQDSMSVALYAMFIGLLVPSIKKGVKVVILAATSACLNSIFTVTESLSTGWSIVAATLISAVVVEAVQYIKEGGRKYNEQ
ncbi:AzlC family ABC transporter permease [Cytobacillus gottheilii]|uniref:AzlC family ABC transporter permease n=1 Tax=Cytobacillus gottheilii TaxID=859144 RepID=A0ABX8FFK9_9BACI|nr:AzlC family ABC transporter permease [Cytobacillus gottheilii]QVY62816.1 AzlC family ABC transporter permease [Cytobacillus gottheilii]